MVQDFSHSRDYNRLTVQPSNREELPLSDDDDPQIWRASNEEYGDDDDPQIRRASRNDEQESKNRPFLCRRS